MYPPKYYGLLFNATDDPQEMSRLKEGAAWLLPILFCIAYYFLLGTSWPRSIWITIIGLLGASAVIWATQLPSSDWSASINTSFGKISQREVSIRWIVRPWIEWVIETVRCALWVAPVFFISPVYLPIVWAILCTIAYHTRKKEFGLIISIAAVLFFIIGVLIFLTSPFRTYRVLNELAFCAPWSSVMTANGENGFEVSNGILDRCLSNEFADWTNMYGSLPALSFILLSILSLVGVFFTTRWFVRKLKSDGNAILGRDGPDKYEIAKSYLDCIAWCRAGITICLWMGLIEIFYAASSIAFVSNVAWPVFHVKGWIVAKVVMVGILIICAKRTRPL